jgi:hypothetical protein
VSEPNSPPSKLLLEEYFTTGDDRFLEIFTQFASPTFLAVFVQRLLGDSRPWVREQIIAYTTLEWNLPGHEIVVKKLFKHFEAQADHEMLAHFMVALDRLVRRSRVNSYRYNWQTRTGTTTENLYARPNQTVVPNQRRKAQFTDWRGRVQSYFLPLTRNYPQNRLFSHRTRNYLRRRIWRYFRRLSFQKPDAYLAAVTTAAIQYQDEDFAAGENILDNWSLVHMAYYHSPAISFTQSHANLIAGHSLGELAAAPYQPLAWKTKKGEENLLDLLAGAQSSLVRIWAMELLQRDHQEAMKQWDIATLIRLMNSTDPRVQEFAAELFESHSGLGTLDVEVWLQLLSTSDQGVLPLLCDAIRKHVRPERLDKEQILNLTVARPAPVSRLGLELLQARHKSQPVSTQDLAVLASVQCESTAEEIAAWALNAIGSSGDYDLESVIEFFDALLRPTRIAAMTWLTAPTSPGFQDPVLWSRLVETPFDDIRLGVVENLQQRQQGSAKRTSNGRALDVSQLWVTVILGVHRGGRTKLKAVKQVAAAISTDETLIAALLPVLAVAVRSIRGPERREALSAVVTLAMKNESLRVAIQQELPELMILDESQSQSEMTL